METQKLSIILSFIRQMSEIKTVQKVNKLFKIIKTRKSVRKTFAQKSLQ